MLLRMGEHELIRKSVGKRRKKRSASDCVRDLNRFLGALGVKANDDDERRGFGGEGRFKSKCRFK